MANDERRDLQIRERAGLEESLINQDFKDFLQRWGTPILLVFATAAVGYFAWNKYKVRKADETTAAFTELNSRLSESSPSPENFLSIAMDHANVPTVVTSAKLYAADAYMNIVRRGIKPGAALNPDGTLADPAEVLSPEERELNLTKAQENYQWVLNNAGSDSARALDAIGALYGLAAVAESRGKLDEAKGHYERIVALSKPWGDGGHAKLAQQRIDSLPSLATLTALPEKAMVPVPLNTTPAAPAAAMPEAGLNLGGAATEGAPAGTVTPVETVPAPAPAAEPAPAPAPEEPKKP
ncbi:MAG TPA: hypothetical protein VK157_08795 [Phycisphaerales bacterium]|nr:hypothetical protein [Phycisphaerales bacterium]